MPRYSITIAFNADRTISEDELYEAAVQVCIREHRRVLETADGDGNDLDFTVTDTEVFTMKIKE